MTTVIEVIDTAVKIGLGALISGITSYCVISRNHNHEFRKATIDDASSLLKEGALKLEKSSSLLNNAIEEYDVAALTVNDGQNGLKQARAHMLSAYNEGKDAKALFYLVGLSELGKLTLSYLETLQTMREIIGTQSEVVQADKNALCEQAEKAQKSRQVILDALSQSYEAVRKKRN